MKTYQVTITEKLQTVVEVEAESLSAAEQTACDNWKNSEYILDADDFCGVDFKAKPTAREREDER